jgi:hypothetical protein
MAQQVINVGASANDGTGDQNRTAFQKINANFSEVYSRSAVGADLQFTDNTISSVTENSDVQLTPDGVGNIIFNANGIVISQAKTPLTTSGDEGDKRGMIAWDANYIYVCIADYTDGDAEIWKRTTTTAW